MKRTVLLVVLLCSLPSSLLAGNRNAEQGTIVRMRMTDCMVPQHTFMSAMAGVPATNEQCPEYVLVTGKVVYVVVGKASDQLVPLAETTRFRLQNNEVMIRVDDARREARFHVKAMVLRAEWDRSQQIEEAEAVTAMTAHRHLEGAALMSAQQ